MEALKSSVLKIYASSTDKIGHKLLYEYIVELAKKSGISGVTVYRGIMGFGQSSSRISTSRYWELTDKLPVMIEIVDKTVALEDFFHQIEPELLKMPKGCLVSMEPIKIILQKEGEKR